MSIAPKDFPDHLARKYFLTTDYDQFVITQTLDFAGYKIRSVMDTREDHIRRALVAMGWTPPGADIAATPPDSTGDTSSSAGGGTET